MKKTELSGKQLGRWRVIGAARSRRSAGGATQAYWHCQCACGERSEVRAAHLLSGRSASCGCLQREVAAALCLKHGMHDHPLYETWLGMRQRCENPRNERYADWGGRGIKVCARWNDFAAFVADMGPRPDGRTLDRRDNDGDYEPSNCRWATGIEQARNKRPHREYS